MGVLSGVALLNRAYEVMISAFDLTEDKERVIAAMRIMADKTGINGMLGGQSVDVENDGKPLEREMLDYIYKNKTSALIEASMMTGAVLAGASEEELEVVEQAAENIGLAFQIQDDILLHIKNHILNVLFVCTKREHVGEEMVVGGFLRVADLGHRQV